ncbi:MAG: DNA polymerase/3'-5' exonuclease PolX [Nitrospinae bacterium]|nr:DNA polymerase/3'-5' exonuclease PolX [Nitrospinota bacterium]
MDKTTIASALHETGVLLEILGENPFKVKAFINAARAVEAFSGDLAESARMGTLTQINGVGKSIAGKIGDMFSSGHFHELDELRAKIPPGVMDMLKIPGLGPKKVKIIWEKMGVTTVGELEYACNENRLVEFPGFGAKSQENVLKGIKLLTRFAGRRLLSEALVSAGPLLEWVVKSPHVQRAQIAGSLRRGLETVKDIDIVSSSKKPEEVMERFIKYPGVTDVINHGPTKSSVRLDSGFQADLRVVADDEYAFALAHFTGSREHNTIMRGRAKDRGLKLNEYGLFKGEQRLDCVDEAAIFKSLGLSFIPPEMREGFGEIGLAEKGAVPELMEPEQVKGIFHCHTKRSDGAESAEEMAKACKTLGYEYLGISDHSKTAAYAGGLSDSELLEQGDEIAALNGRMKEFRVFHGVESDILADGSLDYPSKILEKLDFVIASIHSGFTMDEKKMTDRIIAAIKNPFTTMLGHPTGRLLLAREGYSVNLGKVLEACAEHEVVMELNANPHRLDIDWRMLALAKKLGVKVSINPDAHRAGGLTDVYYGVKTARKGGLRAQDVFNTLPADKMAEELKRRKKKK